MSRALDARRYAEKQQAGICVKCPKPADTARVCGDCWLVEQTRRQALKASLKYGREQAREAR
jgi:NMD protein affecting ribosome stability and mRNA decay